MAHAVPGSAGFLLPPTPPLRTSQPKALDCGSLLPLSPSQPAGTAPSKHPSEPARLRQAPARPPSQHAKSHFSLLTSHFSLPSPPPNKQPKALDCCRNYSSPCARSAPTRPPNKPQSGTGVPPVISEQARDREALYSRISPQASAIQAPLTSLPPPLSQPAHALPSSPPPPQSQRDCVP
jgi:hypothetical protein